MLEAQTSMAVPGDFRLELTVDSNIVIAETFACLKHGSSFLMRLLQSPFIKLYGPPELEEEVEEKIREKLPRGLNIGDAKRVARQLLARVEVVPSDLLDCNAIKEARSLIGGVDPEDVPFLALTFAIPAHGVATRDLAHFGQVPGLKIWRVGEAARVVALFRRGTFTFVILAEGLPAILRALYDLIVAFLAFLVDLGKEFVNMLEELAQGAWEAAASVPWPIWAVVGGALVAALILSEDFRNWVGTGVVKVGEFLQKAAAAFVEFTQKVIAFLKELFTALRPLVDVAIAAVGFLFYETGQLVVQAQSLAQQRMGGRNQRPGYA